MGILLVRHNNLPNQDAIFQGGEPSERYEQRRRIIVEDSFDLVANDCTDVTTNAAEVFTYAKRASRDYLQYKEILRNCIDSVTWANLSDSQKNECIKTYTKESAIDKPTDDTNKVVHLFATGQVPNGNTAAASAFLVKAFASHHTIEIEATRSRIYNEKLYEIVGTYLSIPDASDFFLSVESLFIAYANEAIRGTNDGSVVAGLLDYIESTPGTAYENAGLASKMYVMQNGDADMTNFISELICVLRHGVY